jgi:hypothetical protein
MTALAVVATACGSKTDNTASSSKAESAKASASAVTTASAAANATKPVGPKKGPLPVGFTLAVPAPKSGDTIGETGIFTSLTMSATDDPLIAYIEKGTDEKLHLAFISWDRDAGKWKGPIVVDSIDDLGGSAPVLQIARDKSSSALGIAYRKSEKEEWLALSSDSGTSWKKEKLPSSENVSSASLAMAKGGQFVAFNEGSEVKVLSRFAATGDFKVEKAPLLADSANTKGGDVSVAVDSDGKPGVLYGLAPKEAYNTAIAFWRPGDAAPSKVIDSGNYQNDAVHLSLAFAGNKPRAAVNLAHDGTSSPTYFIASDDGKEWASPINVAKDGGQSTDWYLNLAVTEKAEPRPEAEALALPVVGGNTDGTKCGQPKLARMTDMKSFATCSPDTNGSLALSAKYASASFDAKGKLYMALSNTSNDAKLPAGLLVWHE